MITIFSTPKPFIGLESIIQKNAIKSWILLDPEIEIIIFGEDPGVEGVTKKFGIKHYKDVPQNIKGTKYLGQIFAKAQEIAKYETVCYVNCDIILTKYFIAAIKSVQKWKQESLMVGYRWDVDIKETLRMEGNEWEKNLKAYVYENGEKHAPTGIDYFVFPKNSFFKSIPSFVVGIIWDNWLIWKARSLKIPVVDISHNMVAIHQNHDYLYHPDGQVGVRKGENSKYNYQLAGGEECMFTLVDANYILMSDGPRKKMDNKSIRRCVWMSPALFPLRKLLRWLNREPK